MDDFYAVLGVPPNAASGEIKSRYRFLSHAYHPDKFSSDAHKRDAEEAFKKINEAFQTLSNPGLRADYDRRRADSSTHGTGHSTPRHSPANSTSPRWAFTGLLNPALTTALVIGIVILSYAVLRVRKATKSPGDAQQAVAFVPGAIDGPPLTLSERSSQPVSKSQLSDDATALFDFGKGKEASGHFLEALAAYKRCLNLAPQDLDVVMTVGQCAERLGRYDEAVEAYSRATRTWGWCGASRCLAQPRA